MFQDNKSSFFSNLSFLTVEQLIALIDEAMHSMQKLCLTCQQLKEINHSHIFNDKSSSDTHKNYKNNKDSTLNAENKTHTIKT